MNPEVHHHFYIAGGVNFNLNYIFIVMSFQTFINDTKIYFPDKNCGIGASNITDKRIGSGTDDAKWPWMASIGSYSTFGEWKHLCGATLIDHELVVTAAHCVVPLKENVDE